MAHKLPTAQLVITLSWNERSKRWDIRASLPEGDGTRRRAWLLSANSQVPMNETTAIALAMAVVDDLESSLPF